MPDLVEIIRWEGILLLGAVFAAVAAQILTGKVSTGGLIEGRTRRGTRFVSASRVQLLIATAVAAVQYLSQVAAHPQILPEIAPNWLLLLGGSQALYLANKFHGKSKKSFHV